MKILYHHRTASRDGQAVHIAELVEALRRAGHEVIVIGPQMTEGQRFGEESGLVTLLRRRFPKFLTELLELAYSVIALRRLDRAYREHRPELLYERFNLFLLSGVWLKRRYGVPFFLEVNAPLYEERLRHGGLALKRLAAWSERTAWRAADRVLPVTRVLAGSVRDAGVPQQKIAVIANGIDAARFLGRVDRQEAKARIGLAGKLVLGFTGFVRDWHGLNAVVDVLAEHDNPDLRLVVAGEGPGLASLQAQAASLGVDDRIRFLGLVDRERIPSIVAAFDIALQPAVTAYASPLKLFEYMALECAIIAPKNANIEEILTDGETALLFQPKGSLSFRAQLDRLCADAALRQRLGRAARKLIVDRDLTWDGNAKRVETLYHEVVAERARRQPRIDAERRDGVSA